MISKWLWSVTFLVKLLKRKLQLEFENIIEELGAIYCEDNLLHFQTEVTACFPCRALITAKSGSILLITADTSMTHMTHHQAAHDSHVTGSSCSYSTPGTLLTRARSCSHNSPSPRIPSWPQIARSGLLYSIWLCSEHNCQARVRSPKVQKSRLYGLGLTLKSRALDPSSPKFLFVSLTHPSSVLTRT